MKLFGKGKKRPSDNRQRAAPAEKTLEYRGLLVPLSGGHVPEPIVAQLLADDYEAPELVGIEGLVQDGDRILELGCGLGVVSGLTSRMAEGLEILSFEANPNLTDEALDAGLQGNLCRCGTYVRIRRAARDAAERYRATLAGDAPTVEMGP